MNNILQKLTLFIAGGCLVACQFAAPEKPIQVGAGHPDAEFRSMIEIAAG